MKIQATRVLTDAELKAGYERDFDTSQNTLTGIMFLQPNGSLFHDESFQLNIAEDTIFPRETPMSLLQTNTYVNPNERFFTLFKPRTTTNRKYKITCYSANVIPDVIVIFKLEKK